MQLTLICLATSVLSGTRSDPIELCFRPRQGQVLTKTIEFDVGLQIEHIYLGDVDLAGGLGGADNWDGSIEVSSRIATVDEYLRVGRDRPLELEREFETLRTTWGWNQSREVLHPLTYRTVLHTWNGESSAYDLRWLHGRAADPLPPGLWEDLDQRGLLPEEPVEVGASWTVPLGRLAPSLLPGGMIHRDPVFWETWRLDELEQALRARPTDWLESSAMVCTLESVDTLDGRRLAEVGLEWRWSTWFTPIETGQEAPWWETFGTTSAEFRLDVRGEGTLTWDLEGGHLRAFELAAQADFELSLDSSWGPLSVRGNGRGEWSAEARAER